MPVSTLTYINNVLPFQKLATRQRQADILGIEGGDCSPEKIAQKVLDISLSDLLVCIQAGKETPLNSGPDDALITVMPLIDPQKWAMSIAFPLSGPRHQVQRTLKTLKLRKK